MVSPLLASACILLPLGCAPAPLVADRPVIGAALERYDASRVSVVIGAVEGDALLVFEEPDGRRGAVPVHLGGGALGVVFDLSFDPEDDHVVPLALPDRDLGLHDLFGTYRGTGVGGGVILEGSSRRLRNRHGVALREDHLALGMGFQAGFEWLVIREGGDEGRVDTGASLPVPELESGGGCSGPRRTGETGLPPSPATGSPSTGSPSTGSPSTGSPSTGAPSDTGPSDRAPSGGCGGSDDDPDAAPETDGADGGCDGADSGCDGVDSGCDCDGSSCDHGGGSRTPMLLALVLGWLGRRRAPPLSRGATGPASDRRPAAPARREG